MRKIRPTAALFAVIAGLVLGLGGIALGSAEGLRFALPSAEDLQPLETLDPVRALPRTALVLAMTEARFNLEANRPWAAWTTLRNHVETPDDAPSSTVLLAARAAAGWGGWDHVRELLEGREWLGSAEEGTGWFLLGRAEEEAGQWMKAAAAYRHAAEFGSGRTRGISEARLGGVLREAGEDRGAATAFDEAAQRLPEIADWLSLLALEARVAAGQSPSARTGLPAAEQSGAVRGRRARAEAAGWAEAGNVARALDRLERAGRILAGQGMAAEAAALGVDRARLLDSTGRTNRARGLLRSVAWETSVPAATRRYAAELLGEITPRRTASEELARAAAYEAADQPELAARALRAAMGAGAQDNGGVRFRLGMLLFDAGQYGPARDALLAAANRLADREKAAEAELYAARALYRDGGRQRGVAELERVAERRAGTAAAGSALFLLGDLSPRIESAISLYRRAASVRHSPYARQALFRVGDRELKTDDPAAAIRAWEMYIARYPRGDQTAGIAFRTGLLHERAGRAAQARSMYTAASLADPLSYYAVRAANRLGTNPLGDILDEPRPWPGLAADPVDAAAVLARLDLLDETGLHAEWEDELDAAVRHFEDRPAALLAITEGIRDRGHAFKAILLGRQLHELRGEWDGRLLRVVFPFPYRGLIEREAERGGVDPILLAALIRQESMFRSDARSRVGATGLGQIMPSTGRWLAGKLDIEPYEQRLLQVPEVNLRIAADYIGDLTRRYDGARDLALAGYNAGPGRADRWRHELDYAGGVDTFRERIPFDETRHYVKIVLRNAAVYEQLYGEPRAPGLVHPID